MDNKEPSQNFNFHDYLLHCCSRWLYFVTSVVVVLIVACFYLISTAPTYKADACVLIKQDRRSGSSGLDISTSSFSDMGSLFSQQTNVHNEVIAFQSPIMIDEVVKNLDLRADYKSRHLLYKKTLYGASLPVSVRMVDYPESSAMGMTIWYNDDSSVKIGDMYFFTEGEKIKCNEEMVCHFEDTLNTPVGRLAIVANPSFFGMEEPFKPIEMTYTTQSAARRRYSGELSVSLTNKEATAITLSLSDKSAGRAVDVLTSLIDVYNSKWIDDRNQIAVSTSEFINERLVVIEKELGLVDSDISKFKSRNKIVDVTTAGTLYMNKSNNVEDQIVDINNRLSMAGYVRDYIVSYDPSSNKLLPASLGVESGGIDSQIGEYNTQQLKRNNLLANSSERNPRIVEMDMMLSQMRSSILSSIENYIVSLRKSLAAVEGMRAKSDTRITNSPRQAEYLTDIERKQKVKESLYLYLLQKREENELSQAFAAYNTRILTPPYGENRPVSPVRNRVLLLAFIIGLAIPAGLLYYQDSTNVFIRGRKDLERLSAPFMGEIPFADSHDSKFLDRLPLAVHIRKFLSMWSDRFKVRARSSKDELVVSAKNRNVINESFRVVRANFEFMCAGDKSPVIMLTSFNIGSGKTFVTANLAVSLAIKGRKVCVVDLDIRKCSMSRHVSSPRKGVTNYLAGKLDNIEDVIVKNSVQDGLDIIPAGFIPPNPTELLYSEKMPLLIDYLKKHYDYVFLDCPPVEIVADASIIGQYADRTMFVVRAGLFRKEMLGELEKYYECKQYKNIMVVLNGTEIRGGYSYNRYGQYYGSHHYYGNAYGSVYGSVDIDGNPGKA